MQYTSIWPIYICIHIVGTYLDRQIRSFIFFTRLISRVSIWMNFFHLSDRYRSLQIIKNLYAVENKSHYPSYLKGLITVNIFKNVLPIFVKISESFKITSLPLRAHYRSQKS